MTPLPTLCEGGTAVCLASGPSLTAEDVEYVRGKAVVIAVNDAATKLAPWADVIYSSDQLWRDRNRKAVKALPGVKVTIHASGNKPTATPVDGKHCPECRLRLPSVGPCPCDGWITLNNGGVTGLSREPHTICSYYNSGGAAINVAVQLGARRVLLLGYDLGPDPKGRRHFFDTEAQTILSPFHQFRKLIGTMVEPLKSAGVEVINCSRRTNLEHFPCQPLREALPEPLRVAS